jgi:hypothetical protein
MVRGLREPLVFDPRVEVLSPVSEMLEVGNGIAEPTEGFVGFTDPVRRTCENAGPRQFAGSLKPKESHDQKQAISDAWDQSSASTYGLEIRSVCMRTASIQNQTCSELLFQ